MQELSNLAAVLGLILTLIVFLFNNSKERKIREEENEIRRLDVTGRMLKEIRERPLSMNALNMIDMPEYEYITHTGEKFTITHEQARTILSTGDSKQRSEPKRFFVRECFDSLGSDMNLLGVLFKKNLINRDFVVNYFRYYVNIIDASFNEMINYFEAIECNEAIYLINQVKTCNTTAPSTSG